MPRMPRDPSRHSLVDCAQDRNMITGTPSSHYTKHMSSKMTVRLEKYASSKSGWSSSVTACDTEQVMYEPYATGLLLLIQFRPSQFRRPRQTVARSRQGRIWTTSNEHGKSALPCKNRVSSRIRSRHYSLNLGMLVGYRVILGAEGI
jgi:hypothetical protein